jgi:RNA polymerase sigma-70 factor (ECF subfamily)
VDPNQNEQLAVLWTKAQRTVAAYIGSLIPDYHQSEDVLHQTAITLVRKFDEYDPSQPFVAWALGVARYEVLKHRQKYVSERAVLSGALADRLADAYASMADELDDRREALLECLQQLEGRSREAIRLRYLGELKPPEIAERLQMRPGALRVLLHRVHGSLRECIERRLAREAE